MSKIGYAPVKIHEGIAISIEDQIVYIKNNIDQLEVVIPRHIKVEINDNTMIYVTRDKETKKVKALHGLIRMLIYNAIQGLIKPWEKKLQVVGTGYKVSLKGEDLQFEIGYSHPVIFKKIKGITYTVDGQQKITISGINKQQVGEIAHKIKTIRKPDPYKGKGIRYAKEFIKLKPGKKAKTA